MNINPINFKGIYRYQVNTQKNYDKFKSLLDLEDSEGSDFKLVIGHQNYQSVAQSLFSYKERYADIPSVEWMIQYAQHQGIELPKYFTNGDYDFYILTDKDKKDFEKTLEKRERPINTRRILSGIYRQSRKEEKEEDLIIDMLLRRLSMFAKNEQKEFAKFLEGRQIEPMDVDFSKDGSAKVNFNK